MKCRILCCCVLLWSICAVPAAGQVNVIVHRVETTHPQPLRFPFDGALVVPVGTPNAGVRPLRVRVFGGTKNDLLRRPADGDDCVTLKDAWVFDASPAPGGWFVARLQSTWLTPVGPASVADGRYTLIFEEIGKVEEALRIRKTDMPQYVSNAVEVVVKKDGYQPPDMRQAVAAILADRTGPPPPARAIPCARVLASKTAVLVIESNPCVASEPKPKNWLRRLFG